MVNESECSKKFKKLAERATACARKEVRLAKEYSKLMTTYSTITDIIAEDTKKLNSINLLVRKQSQKIDALQQIYDDREAELNKIDKEIEDVQKKIADLNTNDDLGSEKKDTPADKLLTMNILQICTKTHITECSPNVIRGFSANTTNSKIIPFEIDRSKKTKKEVEDALWDNVFRCSEHASQWERLLGSSSE